MKIRYSSGYTVGVAYGEVMLHDEAIRQYDKAFVDWRKTRMAAAVYGMYFDDARPVELVELELPVHLL